MPILTNKRHEAFCINVAVNLLSQAESYINAGYKCNPDEARIHASKLMTKDSIRLRIEELSKNNLEIVQKTSITNLHSKAVEVAGQLLDSSNEYIRASILKTVLERSEPIVKQSQSIRITVDSKDRDRRCKVLEKWKAKAVLIPGTQEREGGKDLTQ